MNKFLEFRQYNILPDKRSISHEKAKSHAETEYDKFNKKQNIESAFDRVVNKLTKKTRKTGNEN
ncbi:MAG: virulence RhuM family protein [Elusimicrobiaceae bacterium]|nr:virulence RhuM family protein [Elusimicrobiaceae bacterium]